MTDVRPFDNNTPAADEAVVLDDHRCRLNRLQNSTDTDTTAYDLDADRENLIMYTCYPFGTLQYTDQRYFIYCDYVSGPTVEPQQP